MIIHSAKEPACGKICPKDGYPRKKQQGHDLSHHQMMFNGNLCFWEEESKPMTSTKEAEVRDAMKKEWGCS